MKHIAAVFNASGVGVERKKLLENELQFHNRTVSYRAHEQTSKFGIITKHLRFAREQFTILHNARKI